MLNTELPIIIYSGAYYAVVGFKSYEDMGSCSYSRDYNIIHLDSVEKELSDSYFLSKTNAQLLEVRAGTLPFTDLEATLELQKVERDDVGDYVHKYKLKGSKKWKKILTAKGKVKENTMAGNIGRYDYVEDLISVYSDLTVAEVQDVLDGKVKVKITVEVQENNY